ncbi:MAG: hypothetical protein C0467_26625 [Planctomycetaceae bacterium]|nr:hypothetical protein [Planctomycetaceae bacterium]
MTFDDATTEILRASGWFPGRSAPTDPWTSVLEPQGFVFHELALAQCPSVKALTAVPGVAK